MLFQGYPSNCLLLCMGQCQLEGEVEVQKGRILREPITIFTLGKEQAKSPFASESCWELPQWTVGGQKATAGKRTVASSCPSWSRASLTGWVNFKCTLNRFQKSNAGYAASWFIIAFQPSCTSSVYDSAQSRLHLLLFTSIFHMQFQCKLL